MLLAEAGAGKTEELRHAATRWRTAGDHAFFLRLEHVADEFDGAFEVGDLNDFERWRSSRDEGWVLLDSVDEARLRGPSDFERAIRKFATKVRGAEDRLHLLITSRISAWRPKTDLELCERFLPLPAVGRVAEAARTDDATSVRHPTSPRRRKREAGGLGSGLSPSTTSTRRALRSSRKLAAWRISIRSLLQSNGRMRGHTLAARRIWSNSSISGLSTGGSAAGSSSSGAVWRGGWRSGTRPVPNGNRSPRIASMPPPRASPQPAFLRTRPPFRCPTDPRAGLASDWRPCSPTGMSGNLVPCWPDHSSTRRSTARCGSTIARRASTLLQSGSEASSGVKRRGPRSRHSSSGSNTLVQNRCVDVGLSASVGCDESPNPS